MANTKYLPMSDGELVAWAQNASGVLAANPTSFAQTAAVATAFTAKVTAFANALTAWREPATRTPIALSLKNTTRDALVNFVRPLVRQIQAAPIVTDAQRTQLRITVPKTPTHPGNPGTASAFKASLTALGELDLSWKCTNPTGGTVYQIYRKLDGGAPVYIGGSGAKKFVDASVPSGTGLVTYQIQAVRSSGIGAWASFDVKFGVGGVPNVTTSAATTPVKIAA